MSDTMSVILEKSNNDNNIAIIKMISDISESGGFGIFITAFCLSEFGTKNLNDLTNSQLDRVCRQVLALRSIACQIDKKIIPFKER